MSIFEPFPKLARLSRKCIVTEKIDGTNAQIIIVDPETLEGADYEDVVQTEPVLTVGTYHIYAGSRTRLIKPGKNTDNYGFAQWVSDHPDLVDLGPGRHFGEWWGKGIQRGYGLAEKRFSLFDTSKWASRRNVREGEFSNPIQEGQTYAPDCCDVVPWLWRGLFDTYDINQHLRLLAEQGSQAAPGFMNPEGIVVFHEHARVAFKKTFDDKHKENA